MTTTYRHRWQPALEPAQAAAAVSVAQEVSERLRLPVQVEAAAIAAAEQTAFPKGVHWQPYGTAQGYAGLAVMCGYLDHCFPKGGWDVAAHNYITLAGQSAALLTYPSMGLWSGLTGLAFAAWYLSRGAIRYRKFLASLDEVILPAVVSQADTVVRQQEGLPVNNFDVISGLSGIGAYLLCRQQDAYAAAVLEAITHALIILSAEEAGLPRWHTPVHWVGDEIMVRTYPNGNLNCGLAHGIPGPLAFLALAKLHGVAAEGLMDAINRLADWLVQHRCDDSYGINWPTAVPLERVDLLKGMTLSVGLASSAPFGPSRTAWCYGSPGIARALWLAGQALGSDHYSTLAIASMEAVYRRPLALRQIDSPTFCHGVAGLLQITLRFAHDTHLPMFYDAACVLSEQLLSLFDPTTRLGYYSLEPGGRRVDQPGLLDGAPGVCLVLLAAATDVYPAWDRLFLLA